MSGSPEQLPISRPPPSIDESPDALISSDEHVCKRPGSPGTDTSQVKRPKTDDDESSNPQMDKSPENDDIKPSRVPAYLGTEPYEERKANIERIMRQYTEDQSQWNTKTLSWCDRCTIIPGDICKGCGQESLPENWGWPYGMSCHACGAGDHFTTWCKNEEKLARFREWEKESHKLYDPYDNKNFKTKVYYFN